MTDDSEHKMTVRIPKELHKAAKVKAVEIDSSLSEVIRDLLRLWLAGQVELPKSSEEEREQQDQE